LPILYVFMCKNVARATTEHELTNDSLLHLLSLSSTLSIPRHKNPSDFLIIRMYYIVQVTAKWECAQAYPNGDGACSADTAQRVVDCAEGVVARTMRGFEKAA